MLAGLKNSGEFTLSQDFPLANTKELPLSASKGICYGSLQKAGEQKNGHFPVTLVVTCCPAHVHGEIVTSALRCDCARTAPGLNEQLLCTVQEA